VHCLTYTIKTFWDDKLSGNMQRNNIPNDTWIAWFHTYDFESIIRHVRINILYDLHEKTGWLFYTTSGPTQTYSGNLRWKFLFSSLFTSIETWLISLYIILFYPRTTSFFIKKKKNSCLAYWQLKLLPHTSKLFFCTGWNVVGSWCCIDFQEVMALSLNQEFHQEWQNGFFFLLTCSRFHWCSNKQQNYVNEPVYGFPGV
jgi:hypothetical protein